AALYLHGLGEEDRHWMLEALSEEERESVHATLIELDEMGVPRGNAWLTELHAIDRQEIACGDPDTEIEKIDEASLPDITQALESEPDWVVALLLKQKVWSWRQGYISNQYLQKREHLLRLLETPEQPLRPKVKAALIGALAMRLNNLKLESAEGFEAALADAHRNERAAGKGSRWSRLWRR
ncbi:MAG: hypothetical protein P8179_09400, partial [Candidatus Thiodiazotropha sp.]